MRLAMIGYGEAAHAMALGFREEPDAPRITACHRRVDDPSRAAQLRERAAETGVTLSASPAEAVQGAEFVLSLVQGPTALAAAESVAPHLKPGQVYVDLNSISPDGKRRVAAAIATGDGVCVEGAIAGGVRWGRHRCEILLAGPLSAETEARLNAIGMRCEAVGDLVGQASAVKMIRSVVIKGFEALVVEGLRAAETAGVTERILDSINSSFQGLDWRKLAEHYLNRTHQHGARRAYEMEEATATLESLGMAPAMSPAIAETLRTAHETLAAVPYGKPAPYAELLARLVSVSKN